MAAAVAASGRRARAVIISDKSCERWYGQEVWQEVWGLQQPVACQTLRVMSQKPYYSAPPPPHLHACLLSLPHLPPVPPQLPMLTACAGFGLRAASLDLLPTAPTFPAPQIPHSPPLPSSFSNP